MMIVNPPVSRRGVLATMTALPVLVVAACTTGAPKEPTEGSGQPPADPLAAVLDLHVALLASYEMAMTTYPELAPRLQPMRDHVDEHISALAAAQAVSPPSPSSSSSASGSAENSSSAPPPADSAAAVADLVAQENALVDALTPLAISEPAERAPLLGSITAAHACHAAALV